VRSGVSADLKRALPESNSKSESGSGSSQRTSFVPKEKLADFVKNKSRRQENAQVNTIRKLKKGDEENKATEFKIARYEGQQSFCGGKLEGGVGVGGHREVILTRPEGNELGRGNRYERRFTRGLLTKKI